MNSPNERSRREWSSTRLRTHAGKKRVPLRNSAGLYGGAWLHRGGQPTRNGGAGATRRKSPNHSGQLLQQSQRTFVSTWHPHPLMMIITPCGMRPLHKTGVGCQRGDCGRDAPRAPIAHLQKKSGRILLFSGVDDWLASTLLLERSSCDNRCFVLGFRTRCLGQPTHLPRATPKRELRDYCAGRPASVYTNWAESWKYT